MKPFATTLTLLFLMTLCACSTPKPVEPKTVLVEKVIRPQPPSVLVALCESPSERTLRTLRTTRDLLAAKDDYKTALELCASKFQRLVNWLPPAEQ